MAGVSLIGTGETYTTIAAFESDKNTASLVGVEEGQLKAETFAETVNMDGGTTSALDYLHITTADGAEFDHAARTGAQIVLTGLSAAVDMLTVKDMYHRVGGNTANNGASPGSIGIRYEISSGTGNGSAVKFRYSGSNVIKNIVVYSCSGFGNVFGFYDDGSSTGPIDIYTSFAFDLSTASAAGGDAVGFTNRTGTNNINVYYCGADNIYAGSGADDAYGFDVIQTAANCWASRCVTDAPAGSAVAFNLPQTMVTCSSDDTSASIGLQSLVPSSQFVSLTAGSEDYHLVSSADLIDAATDSYSVTWDIDGTVSGVRDDIGFHEYLALSGLVIDSSAQSQTIAAVSISQNYVITASGTTQQQLIDSAGITQNNSILADGTAQQQLNSAVIINQNSIVTIDELLQQQSNSQPGLAQNSVIPPDGIAQGQLIGDAAILQNNVIAANKLIQQQIIDDVVLAIIGDLSTNDSFQASTVTNTDLIQAGIISVNNLLQQVVTDSTIVSVAGVVQSDNLLQQQYNTAVELLQNNVISPAQTAQQQSLASIVLSISTGVIVNSANQQQFVDTVGITENGYIIVADISQIQSLDAASLIQHGILVVDDIAQFQQIQSTGFGITAGWLSGTLVIITMLDGELSIIPALSGELSIN